MRKFRLRLRIKNELLRKTISTFFFYKQLHLQYGSKKKTTHVHHARHDTFFTQNSARFRLHKTVRRCRGLWVVCFLTLKLNMCLKIKPWLFHPPPEATRIKNSSDLSLLQNLDSQPSYTLFFIS